MSIHASIYEKIELQSYDDPTRTVDLRLGVTSVDYYESILRPTVCATLQVSDSGGTMTNSKDQPVGVYQGLPIRGWENLKLKIKANSNTNLDIDFSKRPLVVRQARDLIQQSMFETFKLDLVSQTAIVNETEFVYKSWLNGVTTDNIARDILKNNLKLEDSELDIERSSNKITKQGNSQKPFDILTRLAAMSVSGDGLSYGASAGFFFYETRRGHSFRSIDYLVKQQPVDEFFYTEVNRSDYNFTPEGNFRSLDQKILSYTINRGPDAIDQLKSGTLSSFYKFFDPITSRVLMIDFNSNAYKEKMPTLGSNNFNALFDAGPLYDKDSKDKFSKIISETISFGTNFQGVTKDLDFDPTILAAQSRTRYNSLFSQVVSVQVPLNTRLCAGDVVKLHLPATTSRGVARDDDEQSSGNYLIKDLCHHFDTDASYTSMTLVRDTFGTKRGGSNATVVNG